MSDCQKYRAWAADPTSITDDNERLRLLRHPTTCRDCLQVALDGLKAGRYLEPASGDDSPPDKPVVL